MCIKNAKPFSSMRQKPTFRIVIPHKQHRNKIYKYRKHEYNMIHISIIVHHYDINKRSFTYI